jgi:hypothetical protein
MFVTLASSMFIKPTKQAAVVIPLQNNSEQGVNIVFVRRSERGEKSGRHVDIETFKKAQEDKRKKDTAEENKRLTEVEKAIASGSSASSDHLTTQQVEESRKKFHSGH